ncbi:MAG: dihydrofolate reductase [Microscillaceae bacterium]
MQKISLIVALAQNGVIGREGQLPWRLSNDLKWFKARTLGHCVVMGRKTFAAIGRPLPQRRNLVLSRQPGLQLEGVEVFGHQEALCAALPPQEEVFIIGGAEIYALFLPLAQCIYMTQVQASVPGDAFFPPLNPEEWTEISRQFFEQDEKNEFSFEIICLHRKA